MNEAFEFHSKLEHNIWNYIFYLIYLKNKRKDELNSVEIMVLEKWHRN